MPTTRQCCSDCFGDRGLRKSIIPSLSSARGTCDFCGTTDVVLVQPGQLLDYFELLANIYEPNPDGKLLVEWMKDDWLLFTHPNMDAPLANDLLREITGDGELVKRKFIPSPTYKSKVLFRWDTLRDELMYKNRYFLDETLDTDRLEELLDHLPADDMPEIWYRARIMKDSSLYPIRKMGAPPKDSAPHGRANPTGIPYLYLSSEPETSVAETRPHTGEKACVAEFILRDQIRAVDLRNPRQVVSPFILSDATAIGQLRADIPFLERLGNELTRPVLPRSAAIDYLPSQYLCEFIKKTGKDGVVYRSSVSSGINLALFKPSKAKGRTVVQYEIKQVSYDIEQI